MDYKLWINNAVLEGNTNSTEFLKAINLLSYSIISKRYNDSTWHNKDLTAELLSAAKEGFYTALNKYNKTRGDFVRYAYSFIMGSIHTTYCLYVFGLTVYYATKRKKILEFILIYNNNNDLEQLYRNLKHARISKCTIEYLLTRNKLQPDEANPCLNAFKVFDK